MFFLGCVSVVSNVNLRSAPHLRMSPKLGPFRSGKVRLVCSRKGIRRSTPESGVRPHGVVFLDPSISDGSDLLGFGSHNCPESTTCAQEPILGEVYR